ncbi:MAG: Sec-independent protein translocase subunit TatA [Candidatus Limnocylindria bacterium]
MFRQIGAPEIILILVVLILLFGAKKLPDAARSLGRSMRIFKSEVKEMRNDDDDKDTGPPERPREVEGRVVDRPRAEDPQRVPASEQADRDR